MAPTKKQLAANKKNAQKSTGPVTTIGKSRISINAVSHGVLSRKLILPGESEEDFQQLFDSLASSLDPRGALEFSIVEKITINLWKQQRLIHAESAELNINLQPRKIAETITSIIGCTNNPVTVFELELSDEEHEKWFHQIIEEFKGLNLSSFFNLDDLSHTNLINEFVFDFADASEKTVADYLRDYQFDVSNLVELLQNRCFEIHYRRTEVLQLEELVKIKNTILGGETEKKFARYQSSLNNEFHKLVNTLRDLKKLQSHFIDTDAVTIDSD